MPFVTALTGNRCKDNLVSNKQVRNASMKDKCQKRDAGKVTTIHPQKYCTRLTFSAEWLLINDHKEHLLLQPCLSLSFPADSLQLCSVLTGQTWAGRWARRISKCRGQVELLILSILVKFRLLAGASENPDVIQNKPEPFPLTSNFVP